MLVKSLTEEELYGIGHAFGDYDYGEETGMSAAFSGKEAQKKQGTQSIFVTSAAILSKGLQNLRFCVIISIRKRKD